MNRYVIVGNGAAGVTAAQTIRETDPYGSITILGAEPYPMYSRPGLAYVLKGILSEKQVLARNLGWYARTGLTLKMEEAVSLDLNRQQVLLAGGGSLPYDRLLVATGARAVRAPYAGKDLTGVVYLDTLDGTRDLLRQLRRTRRAVVIGGGITALELCEGLAHQGVEVHYFVRGTRLWHRVFNEVEAAVLEDHLRHERVQLHYETEIEEILGDRRGRVRGVRLKSGGEFSCQMVGIGIGVKPQLELVRETAINCDRGIMVDDYLETSVPHVFAAGDCAQVFDKWSGEPQLDILWPSAVAEGRAAGLNMASRPTVYDRGISFNACLLFGLHISIIGQINAGRSAGEEPEVVQHLSRGSSEAWFATPADARSAWYAQGENSIRLVIAERRLAGALVIGEQTLTDPLRFLIEKQIDITDLAPVLRAGGEPMRRALQAFWMGMAGVKRSVPA